MAENTEKPQESKASPALEGKYKVVGVVPGVVVFRGQGIDLRTISLAKAEKLEAEANFPYLKKINETAPAVRK